MFENDDVKWKAKFLKRSERSCSNKSCKKLYTKSRKKCDACRGKVIREEHIVPRLAVHHLNKRVHHFSETWLSGLLAKC